MKERAEWFIRSAAWLALLVALLVGLVANSAFSQTELHAAPEGSGEACSLTQPCALGTAAAKVRTLAPGMTGDIAVTLRGGIYRLAQPLVLGSGDGGRNGHRVIYRASDREKPVLSGGREARDWTAHDPAKNIFKARIVLGIRPRQLFVNGRRAVRARSSQSPAGYSQSAGGFTGPSTQMQDWRVPGEMEAVGFNEWRSFRCGVVSVAGSALNLSGPCLSSSRGAGDRWPFNRLTWIENDYSLLDEEGEWYYETASSTLYYKPRTGEDMASAVATIPVLENLIRLEGSAALPVTRIDFIGLTFAHATWLRPNTASGFTPIQATHESGGGTRTLAAVQGAYARDIRFVRNVFTQLGGDGLALDPGAQDNAVTGNVFADISANGLRLGNVTQANPAAPERTRGNIFRNNYVARAGAEYHCAIGVWVGYSDSTILDHNEIHDLPYSGVSISWGWGSANYSRNVMVRGNLIHDYMKVLRDGGGVYTLGPLPGSEVSRNYIHHMPTTSGALYPDEGTSSTYWHHNVLSSVFKWLHLWTASIRDNRVEANFTDSPNIENKGTNNIVADNVTVRNGEWPEEARRIMLEAGLEAAYRDIKALADFPLAARPVRREPGSALRYGWTGRSLTVLGAVDQRFRFSLYFPDGREAWKGSGTGTVAFAVPDLPAGLYIFAIRSGSGDRMETDQVVLGR